MTIEQICSECQAKFTWEVFADVENGPCPHDLDEPPEVCDACAAKPCEHGTPGGSFCPECEKEESHA